MMILIYCYVLICTIWFIHNVRTRNTPFNNLERVLTWTLFIPVTIMILIIALIAVVIEWCKERS